MTTDAVAAVAEGTVPARRVLTAAEQANARLGHENLGFLSEQRGFLPREEPLQALPASHRAWDEAAAALPELFRTLALRGALDALPVLPAGDDDLPDRYLHRASVILSIFAHAYHYVRTDPPQAVPASVARPWQEVTRRLGRPAPHMAFADMNAYNWRLRDPAAAEPLVVENLDLLVPLLGNAAEQRFQMTPVEAMARLTPVLGAAVRAQEAVVRDDPAGVGRELQAIADAVHDMTTVALAKVNPNRSSPSYVDPVVWGKTVAPLATPYDPAVPGPSGTAIPSFQLLDVVLGRRAYATSIGEETERARRWFPPHWRDLLAAAEQVSVPDYVRRRGDRELQGLLDEALEAYAGDTGMLGRHRLKTYGYLDLSFKAGRTQTLGGISGGFSDRVWDHTDGELARSRQERYPVQAPTWHQARVRAGKALREDDQGWVGNLVLDVEGAGIRFPAGSRCAVLPEHRPELVARTLRALRAGGDEVVELDATWRRAIAAREAYADATVLPLRTLLRFGRLRPVDRGVAKLLLARTGDALLRRVVEQRAEDQWELWELLDALAARGFDPRQLWRAEPGAPGGIVRVVPPERPRLYSLSNAMEATSSGCARTLELTFARLRYPPPSSRPSSQPSSQAATPSGAPARTGTGSGFLAAAAGGAAYTVPVKVVRAPRFALPPDPARPIVMLAGGTGLAPFRALIQQRRRQTGAGPAWLLFATRTSADIHHGDELAEHVAVGALALDLALSGEDLRLAPEPVRDGALVLVPGERRRIGDVVREPGTAERLRRLLDDGAVVYVCGQAGFARAVTDALLDVLADGAPAGPPSERQAAARAQLRRLAGEDRYLQEVYTTYTGPAHAAARQIDASEVVLRNDPDAALWMVISGRVYDLTEFAHLHPGGDKIVRSYAGMDATRPYRMVLHDANPEVDALLALYEVGVVRRLDLGAGWVVAAAPDGARGLRLVTTSDLYRAWIGVLYTLVEMENAVGNDFGVRDEPVTHDERPGELAASPYKVQLLLQAHQRFRRDYLTALTGAAIERLWHLTSPVGGTTAPAGWMAATLAALRASPAVTALDDLEVRLDVALGEAPESGAVLDWCATACAALEAAARRFLGELKLALRDGVRAFERHEARALSDGADELLAAVRSLPDAYERYLAAVADAAAAPAPTPRPTTGA